MAFFFYSWKIRTYIVTSGFWPRVRARALRAPIFLGSLPRQTGRCAPPPRPSQLRCFLLDPQKYLQSIELGPPTSRASFFPMEHRGYEIWGPLPRPAHRSFADPSGNIFGVAMRLSPSLSLPLQTLHLLSLDSLIIKTKRIAERSDTNCDTHTHTHTHTHTDKVP
jgi:hypothetical protein